MSSRSSLPPLPNDGDSPAERILITLKLKGPQTTAALGSLLNLTGEAVRQQLVKLAEDGLVAAFSEEAHGVGRPAQVWKLTPMASTRFPDTHAELSQQLIGSVRTVLGEAALSRLLAARENGIQLAYAQEFGTCQTLEDRVRQLTAIRRREGYMAEWERSRSGFRLIENHCPICLAASQCGELCQSELRTFQKLLGPGTSVCRTEHIVNGERRCVYEISEAASSAA